MKHAECWQGYLAALATVVAHGLLVLVAFLGTRVTKPPTPPSESVISVVFLAPSAPPVPVEEQIAPEPVPELRRAVAEPDPAPPRPELEPSPVPQPSDVVPLPARPLGELPTLALPTSAPPLSQQALVDSRAAAPPAPAAPPAEQLSGRVDDRWEARVMARLAEFRRYPGAARARGEQGVAVVRMRMDRAGRVLSAVLERSSGSPRLDAAALETFRRAEPLPRIPETMPDEVEIAVPVDFFMR